MAIAGQLITTDSFSSHKHQQLIGECIHSSTRLTLTHFTMLKSTIVFSLKSNTLTWTCVFVGRGSDSRKLSRCPSLRSGSSFGSLRESLCVHRQTWWQVWHFLCNKPVIDVIDHCIWCDVFSCMKTCLYCLWEKQVWYYKKKYIAC